LGAGHDFYYSEAWQTEELSGDMTPGDLITVLGRMHFRNGLLTSIKIDKEARNFIVDALLARRGKA
jgi:hypothetical protein